MEENAARIGFDPEGMHNVILKPVRTMSRAGKGGWRFSFTDNRAAVTKKPYTAKQWQYLAFIFYYTKIHGFAPAESNMQNYFNVSPPSVHQMVLSLESKGLIERTPGLGKSIRLRIAREDLPDLH